MAMLMEAVINTNTSNLGNDQTQPAHVARGEVFGCTNFKFGDYAVKTVRLHLMARKLDFATKMPKQSTSHTSGQSPTNQQSSLYHSDARDSQSNINSGPPSTGSGQAYMGIFNKIRRTQTDYASNCPHTNKPSYARNMCLNCYQSINRRERRLRKRQQEKNGLPKNQNVIY